MTEFPHDPKKIKGMAEEVRFLEKGKKDLSVVAYEFENRLMLNMFGKCVGAYEEMEDGELQIFVGPPIDRPERKPLKPKRPSKKRSR